MYLKALGMSLSTINFHSNKRSIDKITELLKQQKENTIISGSISGATFKKGIKEEYKDIMLQAMRLLQLF